MNNKAKLLALMAMASVASGGYDRSEWAETENQTKGSTIEERNRAKGLKPFEINGKTYWAINYKVALKKSQKPTKN